MVEYKAVFIMPQDFQLPEPFSTVIGMQAFPEIFSEIRDFYVNI